MFAGNQVLGFISKCLKQQISEIFMSSHLHEITLAKTVKTLCELLKLNLFIFINSVLIFVLIRKTSLYEPFSKWNANNILVVKPV